MPQVDPVVGPDRDSGSLPGRAASRPRVVGRPSRRPASDHGRPDAVAVRSPRRRPAASPRLVEHGPGALARPRRAGPGRAAARCGWRPRRRRPTVHGVEVAHGLRPASGRASGPMASSGRMSASPNEPMRVRRRLADVRPAARAPAPGRGPAPGCRCPTSTRPRPGRRPGAAGSGSVVEAVDGHRPGGALHLDALAGQLVQAAAPDLDGRHHRRHLLDLPRQRGGRGGHVPRA